MFEVGEQAVTGGEVGLRLLAWEVSTLADLKECEEKLAEAGALIGSSDDGATKELYARDPDGLEFEVRWLVPLELVDDYVRAYSGELDIDVEIARFGANTPGARARIGSQS